MAGEYQDGFVRQRRSLILVSLVLSVLLWFGIDGTTVRMGPGGGTGVSVNLLDTRFIYWGLFVVWLWFVVRYLQYHGAVHEEAVKSLHTAHAPRISKLFRKELEALGKEEALRTVEPKRSGWQAEVADTLHEGPIVREGWCSVSRKYRFTVTFKDHSGAQRGENQGVKPTASITGLRLYWPLLRAVTPVNIKHPYFTEHWLPLFIAAWPLVLLLMRWHCVFGGAAQLQLPSGCGT